jgi:hypothetical protein
LFRSALPIQEMISRAASGSCFSESNLPCVAFCNGCPYTGDIFTFKIRVTVQKLFYIKNSDNIFLIFSSGFFYDTNLHIFFSKNN